MREVRILRKLVKGKASDLLEASGLTITTEAVHDVDGEQFILR